MFPLQRALRAPSKQLSRLLPWERSSPGLSVHRGRMIVGSVQGYAEEMNRCFVFALFILNVQVMTWTVAVPLPPFTGRFRGLCSPLANSNFPPFPPVYHSFAPLSPYEQCVTEACETLTISISMLVALASASHPKVLTEIKRHLESR